MIKSDVQAETMVELLRDERLTSSIRPCTYFQSCSVLRPGKGKFNNFGKGYMK